MKHYGKPVVLSLLCVWVLSLILVFVACDKPEELSNLSNTDSGSITSNDDQECDCEESPAFDGQAPFGLRQELVFEKAPKTGEPVHLRWSIEPTEGFDEIHAWVQFYYDSGKTGDDRYLPLKEEIAEMLIDGQLDFSGSLKKGEIKSFEANIMFPMEGKWQASVRFWGKNISMDLTTNEGDVPYFAGSGTVERLYITDEYGQFGFPNFCQAHDEIMNPNKIYTVSGYIDIKEPPLLNAPVTINWGAGSTESTDEFRLFLQFLYAEPHQGDIVNQNFVPPEEVILKESAYQQFISFEINKSFTDIFSINEWPAKDKTLLDSLMEQSSVHYSSNAVFNKIGNWTVVLVAFKGEEMGSFIYTQSIYVDKEESHWGWE